MIKSLETVLASLATNLVIFLDVPAGSMTQARARALVWMVIGLISVVLGVIALRSRAGAKAGRVASIVALILGLIGTVVSILHISASTGIGTGGGRAGAIIGLVLALIGVVLGGLALTIKRRLQNPGTVGENV